MARVLVVDDSDLSRQLIGDILKRGGHAVTGVEDGEAALKHVEGETFDVIVTDFMMPGMLGDELVKRVRKLKPEMPVVVVSSYYDSDLFRKVRALPVAKIINKPFSDREILGAISDLTLPKPAAPAGGGLGSPPA
ncbi:MAG: response regulator [Planctomycetales bacterium]|nr:response regulator [Planctomycetales bacterium]